MTIDEMLFEQGKGTGHYSCCSSHPVSGAAIHFRVISFTYMEEGRVREEVGYDYNQG